ncbi:MAG: glycosyltransferase family 2 protein [Chloroflexi bacterium]|nr:glycosyltransferase family 2 protein [Chloroflexota bacterium]
MQAGSLDLSIIIISWNVADLLARCLESIRHSGVCLVDVDGHRHGEGPTTQVIVVDSASRDASVAMIRERYPWVHLIACENNIGFVRGNNLGLEHAHGRLVMLLNPDTELLDGALRRLVEVIESDETTGVVGPHTLNTDGSHQSTRRRFPTLLTGMFESTWLEGLAPRRVLDDYRVLDKPDDGVYPVDWMQGSALLTRRAVWEKVGGLDERYIMYAEEMDWCRRAKDAGWQAVYVGDARIIHHSGQSTAQVKARSHVHFQHSKLRYFRKFHGPMAAALLRGVLVFNYGWQAVLEALKWLVGHKREMRAERVAAYWIVLRSLIGAGERIVMEES